MSTGWEWITAGLRLAHEARMAAPPRESPEDVKFCPVCDEYQLLPEDESIHGPLNLVYHQVCPVCADVHPGAYADLKKRMEVVGDAT